MRKTGIIVALMMILSSIMVLGAATMRAPLASGTVTGDAYVLNVSLAATDVEYTECNFTAYSTSTATTTATVIDTVANTTTNQIVFEGSFNSSTIQDSNDWVFGVSCVNDSTTLTKSVTGVTVDNTEPTAASALSPADETIDEDGDVTFSATANDATTTGCTLVFSGINPGAPEYTMTYATTSCTISLTNIANQEYDWYVRTTDGTDTTNSAIADLQVKSQGVYGGNARVVGPTAQQDNNAGAILAVMGVMLLAWVIFKKK